MATVTKTVSEYGGPVAYTVKDIFGNGESVHTYQYSVEKFYILSRDFHGPTKSEFTKIEPFKENQYQVSRIDSNGRSIAWVVNEDAIVLYAESNEKDSTLPFWSTAINTPYAKRLANMIMKNPFENTYGYTLYDIEEPLVCEIYRNLTQWTPFSRMHPVRKDKSYAEDHNSVRLLSSASNEFIGEVTPYDHVDWALGDSSPYAIALENIWKIIDASPERYSVWVKRTPKRDYVVRKRSGAKEYYLFYFGFSMISEDIKRGEDIVPQFLIQIPAVVIRDVFEDLVDHQGYPVYLTWWNLDDSPRKLINPHEAILDKDSRTGLVYSGYDNLVRKYLETKSAISR